MNCGGKKCPMLISRRNNGCQPCDCKLAPWSEWSRCSVSCNHGTKSRWRKLLQPATCGRKKCPHTTQTKKCKQFHCCTSSSCEVRANKDQAYTHQIVDTSKQNGPEKHGKHRLCKIGLFGSGRCDCYCSHKVMPIGFADYASCKGECSASVETIDPVHSTGK